MVLLFKFNVESTYIFFNISVFVTAIPPTFRLTACKEEDFMCASGLQCVPDAHIDATEHYNAMTEVTK